MGRVFSPEQVAQGEVPQRNDVGETATKLLYQTHHLLARGAITGFVMFGSVPAERYTRRSDINVVAMYPSDRARHAGSLLAGAASAAQPDSDVHVEIAAIAISDADAKKGRHPVDRLFAHQLGGGQGDKLTVIGQNPARYLEFKKRNPREVFEDFLVHKLQTLQQASIDDNPHDVRAVRRALESPPAVARWLSSYLILSGQSRDVPATTKPATLAEWVEDRIPDIAQSQTFLTDLDAEYDGLLDASTEGKIPLGMYRDKLSEIRTDAVLSAQRLIRIMGAKALGW